MWDDFSDFELVGLAYAYGLQKAAEDASWNADLTLTDRPALERLLTLHEYDFAVPKEMLDFNSEVAYN